MNQMVGDEFASALGVKPSGRQAVSDLARQTRRDGLNDGVSHQGTAG
jgi:hypothetical protein